MWYKLDLKGGNETVLVPWICNEYFKQILHTLGNMVACLCKL